MTFINRNIATRAFQVAAFCTVYGLLQAFAFHRLVSFPLAEYVMSGILDALFFVGLSWLLWQVIKYANFKALAVRQRLLNYFVLGFLLLLVWNGLSLIALYLMMGSGQVEEITNVSFTKAIIAFLIYPIAVQFFNTELDKQKTDEIINEEADEIAETVPVTEKLERIVVKTGQKINVITIPEIIYFQADGDYVCIVTDTGKFLKEDTIKYYQTHLSETEFVRVHRSYLVNITKILRIELYEKQSQQLILSNGDKLKISASGYKRLREALGL